MNKLSQRMTNLMRMTGGKSDRGDSEQRGRRSIQQPTTIRYILGKNKAQYANYFSGSAIRGEVVVNFGVHQNWERPDEAIHIELTTRIILNPHTAKRLANALTQALQEYDRRFGSTEQTIAEAAKEAEAAIIH